METELRAMLDILSQVRLFEGIPPDGLARLANRGKRRRYAAGRRLMRQGQVADSLHVILSGCVRVVRDHHDLAEPLVLTELGPGEIVGEMGALEGEPRSATVTAIEDTKTLELSAVALAQTLLVYPEVSRALLRLL